jgi:hypothetical protein
MGDSKNETPGPVDVAVMVAVVVGLLGALVDNGRLRG